jgi:excinuclease ABC subunit C
VFSNRTRPCLLYQIQRCSGPCVGLIDEQTYQEDANDAELFLQGKQTEVLKSITRKMREAADARGYEKAALFRDQIQSLRKIREKQFVDSGNALDADVVACVAENNGSGRICVNLAMVRGGRHLGDKSFFPQNAEGYDPPAAVEAFLAQHYLNRSAPDLIIVGEKIRREILQALLTEQSGRKIVINANPIGNRRVWLNMATENARLALEQMLARQASQEERLQALQQVLNIPGLSRIECFDISHTLGEATIASCVVYDNFSMRNSEYRRYNINGIVPGDDYAAMRDVLSRRYQKIAESEGPLPDLILIDGGRGQVNTASEVLVELGFNDANLLGVAKGEERKPGLEQLIFPGVEKPLQLAKDHPGLHLIQQIRDEAHRFAIYGHRAKLGKSRTSSSLEQIEGIGSKRRQGLLARFGGLKGVQKASVEELQQVEGISRALAERIYRELH